MSIDPDTVREGDASDAARPRDGRSGSVEGGRPIAADELARFRGWLRILAEMELPHGVHRRADPSDIVQQVLARAWEGREGFRGQSELEVLAWLRTILAGTISNTLRDVRRERRDIRREVPLERSLGDASNRVGDWLAKEGTTPSGAALRLELAERVATALGKLPDGQREAVVLRHFAGAHLEDIARQLGRSPGAVALLIHRGLSRLRSLLSEDRP